jgi:transposase-like protein
MQPGMSMTAVAMAQGVNANLLRRWVRDAENSTPRSSQCAEVGSLCNPNFFSLLRLDTSISKQEARIAMS